MDRRHEKRNRFKTTKIRRIFDSSVIFFGGDDDFMASLKVMIAFHDVLKVFFRIGMMIGIAQ